MASPIQSETVTTANLAANEITAADIADETVTTQKGRDTGLVEWLESLRRQPRRPSLAETVPVPLWLLLVILISGLVQLGVIVSVLVG